MRRLATVLSLILGMFAISAARAATIDVDLTHQRMHVTSASGASYVWPVSTARAGFSTPHGYYHPTSLQRMHYSRKYHMSPMPYSIFFRGGYAIHGTYSTAELGRPASHGCVRLAPGNAATLFSMVQAEGARIPDIGHAPRRNDDGGAPSPQRQRARLCALAPRAPAEPMDAESGRLLSA